jgi:hypothetical protein
MSATPQPLSEAKKEAYRHLLYMAMVDIRCQCAYTRTISANPWAWRRRYLESRVAGAVADWLHNLARFSRDNFESFDEDQFWEGHRWCLERFPGEDLERYRKAFDDYMDGVYHIL